MNPSEVIVVEVDLDGLGANATTSATLVQEQVITSTAIITGPPGADGVAGPGLPSGGLADEFVLKNSADPYDFKIITPSTALIPDSTDKRYVTEGEKTSLSNLSGVNSGDQIATTVPFTPNGDITASTVQAAVQEVRDNTDTKLALKQDLLGYTAANDTSVLHLAGTETVTGAKTFSSSPSVPAPSGGGSATNKTYVDTIAATKADDTAVVHLTGTESVAGVKTFSNSPIVPTPTTSTQAANKSYADSVGSTAAQIRTTRYTVGPSDADYIVDGNNDQVQIQQAIDAANTNYLATGVASEVFLRNYTYDCRQFQIKSGVMLNGESKGGVVLSYPSSYNASAIINEHYTVNGTTSGNVMDVDFAIRSLTIRHEGTTKTSGGGLIFQGVKNFTVEDVDVVGSPRFNMLVTGRYGDQIAGTVNVTNGSDNISGTGTSFLADLSPGDIVRVERTGVGETSRFVRIHKVLTDTLAKLDGTYGQETSTGRNAFRMEANSGMVVRRVRFTGNYETTEAWDNSGFGFCDYGLLENCESYNAQGYGFGPDHSQGIQFVNCYAHDNDNSGIGFESCTYSQVLGGTYSRNGIGIRFLSGGHSNTVIGANLLYNTSHGAVVERNSIVFPISRDNQFVNCISAFNEQHGIRIGGGDATKISGGKWYNNGIAGITLATGTSHDPDNTFIDGAECFDNRPTKTQDYGIYILQGTNTRIQNVRALDSENELGGISNAGTSTMIIQSDGANTKFSGKLTNVTDPTTAQDAATKGYVDANIGGGDVVGPASSTDNALARFDLATGKLLQNSVVTVDDNGLVAALRQGSIVDSNGNTIIGLTATASSVNFLSVTNAATGGSVQLQPGGTDASPNFLLKGKGTGIFALRPGTDSTNAVRIQNAAGSTTVLSVDTTNNRVAVGGTTPTSTLDNRGSLALPIATKTANYTLTATDYTILADATSGSLTMTLPAASGCTGRVYVVKKIDASANTVTLDGNGSETVDGATTAVISAQWSSITVQCNGTGWFIT